MKPDLKKYLIVKQLFLNTYAYTRIINQIINAVQN